MLFLTYILSVLSARFQLENWSAPARLGLARNFHSSSSLEKTFQKLTDLYSAVVFLEFFNFYGSHIIDGSGTLEFFKNSSQKVDDFIYQVPMKKVANTTTYLQFVKIAWVMKTYYVFELFVAFFSTEITKALECQNQNNLDYCMIKGYNRDQLPLIHRSMYHLTLMSRWEFSI